MANNKKESNGNDHSAFLPIGIALLVLGLTTANPAFMYMGFVFLIIALSQRKKESGGSESQQQMGEERTLASDENPEE